MKSHPLSLLFILALTLTACSLAEDVTPPPDYQPLPTKALPVSNATPPSAAAAITEVTSTPISASPSVSLTLPLSVTQSYSATILGQIVLLEDGAMPTGMPVILYNFEHTETDMQLAFTSTAQTRPDGSFRFDRVPMKNGSIFGAAADVGGATFTTNLIVANASQVTYTLPLTVTATTTDTSVLMVERMHLIVSFAEAGMAQVQEIYVISNPTHWPVVPAEKDGPVVAFDLPQDVTDLRIDGGTLGRRFIPTDNGFADTQVVYPGAQQYQVAFDYTLSFNDTLDLSRRIHLNTSAAVVLLSDVGMKATSNQLSDQGTFSAESSQYRTYSGNGLAAGSILSMIISEDQSTGNPFSVDTRTSLVMGLAALGTVLIGAGLWTFWRGRSQGIAEPAASQHAALEPEDADALMDAINALDDLYRDGKLPEEAYRQRRAALKEKLKLALQSK